MRSRVSSQAKNDVLRSVRRALDVLDLLALHPEGLPIKRIASELQLNISTCYHLVNSLLEGGYVSRDDETACVRLSLKVAYLSNSVALRVSDRPEWKPLRPLLYQLTESTHAASYLALWQDGDTVIQSIVEGPDAEKVQELYVGFRGGSHLHALGRALLAAGGEQALERYADQPAVARKIREKLVDLDALRRVLDATRRRGYALDLEEFRAGTCCVGVPFVLEGTTAHPRVIASIAVSLSAEQYALHSRNIIREVMRASAEAEARLGLRMITPGEPQTSCFY